MFRIIPGNKLIEYTLKSQAEQVIIYPTNADLFCFQISHVKSMKKSFTMKPYKHSYWKQLFEGKLSLPIRKLRMHLRHCFSLNRANVEWKIIWKIWYSSNCRSWKGIWYCLDERHHLQGSILRPLILLVYTAGLLMEEIPYDCHSSHLSLSEPRESKYVDDVQFWKV